MKLLTPRKLAKATGFPLPKIYAAIETGRFPYIMVGRNHMLDLDVVNNLLYEEAMANQKAAQERTKQSKEEKV